jgi:protein-disulfide isomerase
MPTASYRKRQQQDSANRIRWAVIIAFAFLIVIVVAAIVLQKNSTLPDYPFPPREMGSSTAKVTLEEFADYQCPYCGDFSKLVQPTLIAKYVQTGKIKYVFRNFAFIDENDPNQNMESHNAALAALCAGDQGQFWPYHDLIFKNQTGENVGDYTRTKLISFGLQLNLDSVAFNQCLTTNKYGALVDSDIARAKSLRVESTPSFFLNGVHVNITRDLQIDLFNAIELALKANGQ